MTIQSFDQTRFEGAIQRFLTPAKPISDPEHLKGRSDALRKIARAFSVDGRQVFIFGDRGIGKTSLAQTAATLHQTSDAHPIKVGCSKSTTLFEVVRDISQRAVSEARGRKRSISLGSLSVGLHGLSLEFRQQVDQGNVPTPTSLNQAISLLKYTLSMHSKQPVLLIDEFDQIRDNEQIKNFADFMKQVADQDLNARIIYCGIGGNIESLIGEHYSADRYIAPVELQRINVGGLLDIINDVIDAMDLKIHKNMSFRICQISDGFPYYVHLLMEKILWEVFDDEKPMVNIQPRHFDAGVSVGISDAQTSLKLIYNNAVQKYSDDYQEVLWAIADRPQLRRQVTEIYDNSYKRIMKDRKNRRMLSKNTFNARLLSLKKDRHGSILTPKGAGWYEFTENAVRGYVRLMAQHNGVKLGEGHYPANYDS